MGAITWAAIIGAAASVARSNIQCKAYKNNQRLLNPYDKLSIKPSKCHCCGSMEFRYKDTVRICSYCRSE